MAKLYFYYSAMNAGKSTTLLQAAYNYEERGMRVLLFTPIIDDRAGVGKISSRIGLEREAFAFPNDLKSNCAVALVAHLLFGIFVQDFILSCSKCLLSLWIWFVPK